MEEKLNIAESIVGKVKDTCNRDQILNQQQLIQINELYYEMSMSFDNGVAVLYFEFEDNSVVSHRLSPKFKRRLGRKSRGSL